MYPVDGVLKVVEAHLLIQVLRLKIVVFLVKEHLLQRVLEHQTFQVVGELNLEVEVKEISPLQTDLKTINLLLLLFLEVHPQVAVGEHNKVAQDLGLDKIDTLLEELVVGEFRVELEVDLEVAVVLGVLAILRNNKKEHWPMI